MERLVTSYVSESFLKAAKSLYLDTKKVITPTTPVTVEDRNYAKANRVKQNNHKIIKAFL